MLDRIKMSHEDGLITAYRYYPDLFDERSYVEVIEYYIPEYNIVMNARGILRSDHPRNNTNSTATGRMASLSAIKLSKELADTLKDMLDKVKSINLDYVNPDFINISSWDMKRNGKLLGESARVTQEYCDLFSQSKKISVELDNGSSAIVEPDVATEFWLAYKTYGNDALSSALENYILENTLPTKVTLDDLFLQYSKLDSLDQKSIKERISFEVMEKHDNTIYVSHNRDHAEIDETKTLPNSATMMLGNIPQYVAAASFGGALLSRNSLVAIPGVLAGISFFAAKKYDEYQNPKLIEERHQRAREIFDTLDSKHQALRI